MKKPQPPKALSREAKAIWRKLVDEYDMADDTAALLLLRSAMESYDRVQEVRAILAEEGLTVSGTAGTTKAHPATTVERDARSAMVTALRALNLDLEPVRDRLGRPGGDGITPVRKSPLRNLRAVS